MTHNPEGTVHLVDDDEGTRTAIARLLRACGYTVQAYAGAEAVLELDPDTPSCLLLDVRMPGLSGLQAQTLLQDRRERLPIVFLTGHGDIPMSVTAMRAGAEDFLTKPVSAETLQPALDRALARSRQALASGTDLRDIARRLASLTPREREVCELLRRGQLNKQIADALGMAEQTVKIHRRHVLEKFGVRSAVEAATLLERLDAGQRPQG
ncbi:response regulator transcription factor [Ideonella livida]|uniref:Response regulator transcription factor n=1 Tax=Ideonella livida TaxID=2707176 RepID=A0A7C9TKT3_9BURK|nr:response regulator [Ideonella livida]NDY91803.1 response regulator transcription factor [Ideonella livida]